MSGALGFREILGLRFILLYLGAFTSVCLISQVLGPQSLLWISKRVCVCVCVYVEVKMCVSVSIYIYIEMHIDVSIYIYTCNRTHNMDMSILGCLVFRVELNTGQQA